jgi:hypothetical protein
VVAVEAILDGERHNRKGRCAFDPDAVFCGWSATFLTGAGTGPDLREQVRARLVGLTVFWFRTSRTGVSRHAGLMSPEIPD